MGKILKWSTMILMVTYFVACAPNTEHTEVKSDENANLTLEDTDTRPFYIAYAFDDFRRSSAPLDDNQEFSDLFADGKISSIFFEYDESKFKGVLHAQLTNQSKKIRRNAKFLGSFVDNPLNYNILYWQFHLENKRVLTVTRTKNNLNQEIAYGIYISKVAHNSPPNKAIESSGFKVVPVVVSDLDGERDF